MRQVFYSDTNFWQVGKLRSVLLREGWYRTAWAAINDEKKRRSKKCGCNNSAVRSAFTSEESTSEIRFCPSYRSGFYQTLTFFVSASPQGFLFTSYINPEYSQRVLREGVKKKHSFLDLGGRKVKFGSKKAIFGVIWGGVAGFRSCLGISHPNQPTFGGNLPPKKRYFFTPSLNMKNRKMFAPFQV